MSLVVVVGRFVVHEPPIHWSWRSVPTLPTADLAARMNQNPPRRSDGLTRHSSRNYTSLMLRINPLLVKAHPLPVLCFLALGSIKKNPAAVALGRIKTAKKSAAASISIRNAIAARLAQQTPAQRSAQARKAAKAMWAKRKAR